MQAQSLGQVRKLIADQLGVEFGELAADSNILDDLGADSLDLVELVMALEDAFDVEISDEDVEGLRTIGDVEAFLAKRIEIQAPAAL